MASRVETVIVLDEESVDCVLIQYCCDRCSILQSVTVDELTVSGAPICSNEVCDLFEETLKVYGARINIETSEL
jgi:hypothetical protein